MAAIPSAGDTVMYTPQSWAGDTARVVSAPVIGQSTRSATALVIRPFDLDIVAELAPSPQGRPGHWHYPTEI